MQVNPPPGFGPPSGAPLPPRPGPQPSPLSSIAPATRAKRRVGWIITGIVVAVLGLFVLIGGAAALMISRAESSINPVAEARTPGTASFEAEAKQYDILLVRGRRDDFREASDMECVVTLSDGRTISIDGRVQGASTTVGNTESVGSFDAVPGPTSVFCEADGGDVPFVVDDESLLSKIGLWLVFGGLAVMAIAAGMILAGVFWKKQVRA